MSRLRIMVFILALIVIGFIGLQLIPPASISASFAAPGNPSVTNTIQWNSTETEQLVRAACYDCHSNETRYPWYANIAPVSWLVNEDVNKGRREMNFSTDRRFEGDEMAEQIERGEMPPRLYLPMHPEANLSGEQKQQLIDGLLATFGG